MTDTQSETLDWALWFYWIMATTLGWLAGTLLFSAIPLVVSGAAIAMLQWAVLYNRIHRAWRWMLFSSLGWMLAYILFTVFSPASMNALIGPALGGTVGVAQWFILKQEVDLAGWWVIVSILAWTMGLTVMPGLLTSGALPGSMTGLTLVILFRFSTPRKRR